MSRASWEAYEKFGVSDIFPYGYALSEAEDMVRALKKMTTAEAIVAMIWLRGRIMHLEWENAALKEKMQRTETNTTSRIEAIQIDEASYQALQDRVRELENKNG